MMVLQLLAGNTREHNVFYAEGFVRLHGRLQIRDDECKKRVVGNQL
jgi:hypothetical protein